MKHWIPFAVILAAASIAHGQPFRYEAENGVLAGLNAVTGGGASNNRYVTGFDSDSDKLTINVDVPDGLYDLRVGYRTSSYKGYTFQVNGERGDGAFNASSQFTFDRAGVFNLTGANKSVQILKNWGFYDIDYLELQPATINPPQPVPLSLVDAQASPNAQLLMNYLAGQYGAKTIAGQQGLVGQEVPFPSSTYLTASGGLIPAIRGSDFIEYSPSRIAHGANPNGESERVIEWAKRMGGVVTMMWHWNAPTDLIDQPGKEWWRGFYTDSTTFDVAAALANPGSEKYNLLVSDIDAIGNELVKFQNAGVPVIWRPLHEAQGNPGAPGWFWWGAKGPEPFKQLWGLMHDRLTNVRGLHNLIWEYTSTAAGDDFELWYPGHDVVDIIGQDIYTDRTSSMSGQWYDLLAEYDGEKMLALSETGTLPDPALFDQRGVHWSYFMPWQVDGLPYGVTTNYSAAELQTILSHEDVLTLDELPIMPWKTSQTPIADFDGNGFADGADFLIWQRERRTLPLFTAQADANGDKYVNALDLALWRQQFGQGGAPAQRAVPEPDAAAIFALAAACAALGAGFHAASASGLAGVDGRRLLLTPICDWDTFASDLLMRWRVSPRLETLRVSERRGNGLRFR